MNILSRLKDLIALKVVRFYRLNIPRHTFLQRVEEIAYENYYEGTTSGDEVILKRVKNLFMHGINDNIKIKISIKECDQEELVRFEYRFPLIFETVYEMLRVVTVGMFIIIVYLSIATATVLYLALSSFSILLFSHIYSLHSLKGYKKQFCVLLYANFKRWELEKYEKHRGTSF